MDNGQHNVFRRPTIEVRIGPATIGGGLGGSVQHPVAVQSMTDTDTNDIEASMAQMHRLHAAGCRIVRLTVQGMREVASMKEIAARVRAELPDMALVADVHFQPAVAMALTGVVDKVRINPGNYFVKQRTDEQTESLKYPSTGQRTDEQAESLKSLSAGQRADTQAESLKSLSAGQRAVNEADAAPLPSPERAPSPFAELVDKCRATGTAIRIGVNHGSLAATAAADYLGDGVPQHLDSPVVMAASAMEFLRVCRERDFDRVVVSMKASNPRVMVAAYRELVAAMDAEDMHYPLHLGVTEAGNGLEGRVKSAVGIGALLVDGLGDTIRVSLTEPPENEIVVARAILQAAGLDRSRAEFIACPGCGRTLFSLSPVLEEIKAATQHLAGLKIAVMGCIVNGPGEMADADYGYVGAGPGKITLYRGREVVRRDIPQTEALTALIELLKADGVWSNG
jgi:(E)-4-hydroxy-3-methylbut-2-enyl-diphosphate synthase